MSGGVDSLGLTDNLAWKLDSDLNNGWASRSAIRNTAAAAKHFGDPFGRRIQLRSCGPKVVKRVKSSLDYEIPGQHSESRVRRDRSRTRCREQCHRCGGVDCGERCSGWGLSYCLADVEREDEREGHCRAG
jgi:hypothetical protein